MSELQELPEQHGTLETQRVDLFGMPIPTNESPGRSLREARELRGMSIADVVNSIKFSARQIEAIERNDYSQLPGATFVRGFIRSYAKLLQLDPQPLLIMLDHKAPPTDSPIHLPKDTGTALPQPGERRSYLPYLALLVAVLTVAIGLATYFDWPGGAGKGKPPSTVAAPAAQQPLPYVVQPPATQVEPGQPDPPKTPSPGPDFRQLIFVFEEKSWVEVKDATQRVIFAQNNEAGTRQVVNGKPPFSLVVGNASHVQLQFEDQQVDLVPHTKVDVARLTLE